jgi:hypothetical protein
MFPDLQLWHILGGSPLTFLSVDGGRCRIYISGTSQGSAVDIFYVDGGHSWITISTSQGPRRRRFLALMVGATGSTAPTPPKGPPSMFLSLNGGHSQIYSSGTSLGACHRCFLALMVGAPGSTAPAPPRWPTVDIFYVDGGCSWITVSTS